MDYIGLDIGGTSIKGVLADPRFRILKKFQLPTLANERKEATIKNIITVATELAGEKNRPIGISISGRINKKGEVTFNPNIPLLEGTNLKQTLEKKTGMRMLIENDAACFAIAEHRTGAGKGARNMIGLIIGTGIGSGIIINNQLYKGNGSAGELGHITIDPSDPSAIRCGCGKKGDLESWCSGKNIVKRYKNAGGKIRNPNPAKIFFSKEQTAKKIMSQTIDKLGTGLSNMTAAFDPDMIVIGGGVSNLPFYSQLRDAARKHQYKGQKPDVKIIKSSLELPGALGAAMLSSISDEM